MAIDHNHLDLHANQLWTDYTNNTLPSGTVAYENMLRQCPAPLDGNMISLKYIDTMLTNIRQKLIEKFTQTKKSLNTVDMQRMLLKDDRFVSFLLIISHYAGLVLAKQWQHMPIWYGRHKLITQTDLLPSVKNPTAQQWVHGLAVQYSNHTDERLQRTAVADITQPEMFFVLEPIINRLFGSFDNVVHSIQTDMRVANGLYQAVQQRLPNTPYMSNNLTNQQPTNQKLISHPTAQPSLTDRLQVQPNAMTQVDKSIETEQKSKQPNHIEQNIQQKQDIQKQATQTHLSQSDHKPSLNVFSVKNNSTKISSKIHSQAKINAPSAAVSVAVPQSKQTAKVGKASIKSIVASHGIFAELMQDIITIPVQQNVGNDAYKKVKQFFGKLDKAYPKSDEKNAQHAIINKLTEQQKNNLSKAKNMLQKLAEQGNTDAMLHLAVYLMQGKWFEKNQQQGLALIQTAANAQDSRAMRMMSKLYYQGLGVNTDVNMGRHWLNLAADKGHEEAKKLIKQMDLAQIMIAERKEEIKSDDRLLKVMAVVVVVAILIAIIL